MRSHIVIFLTVSLLLHYAICFNISQKLEQTKVLPLIIQNHAMYHSMDEIEEQIDGALDSCNFKNRVEFEDVLESIISPLEELDFSNQTVCSWIRKDYVNIFKDFAVKLDEKCNNEKHKFGPLFQWVLLTTKEIVAFMCKSTGEEILELFNPCGLYDFAPMFECSEKVFRSYLDSEQQFKNFSAVDTICSAGRRIHRECTGPSIRKNCHVAMTRNALLNFEEALLHHCPTRPGTKIIIKKSSQ